MQTTTKERKKENWSDFLVTDVIGFVIILAIMLLFLITLGIMNLLIHIVDYFI